MLWVALEASRNEMRRLPSLKVLRRMAILPAKISSRNKRRRIKNVSGSDLTSKGIYFEDAKTLEFKVKQLQEFTRNLKEQIKLADSNTRKLNTEKKLGKPTEESNKLADELFTRMSEPKSGKLSQNGNKPNLSSLILSTKSQLPKKLVPAEFEKRINDDAFLFACLIDKTKQNWNGIISRLHDSRERLQGIEMGILKGWLLVNVKGLSYESIEKLDVMLMEAVSGDIKKFTLPMYECVFENLGNLKPPSSGEDKGILKMKQLLERFDRSKESDEIGNRNMTQFILNACLKYATKMVSLENMEYFLSKFNHDYGIKPNRNNSTTVIQFYTKSGKFKQAWDVFDTMKFLSQSHAPDVSTYNSVLHLCNKEGNYAKAIDLYEEMVDRGLEPSLQTINVMARTMATASRNSISSEGKAESLRLLGWKYIHTVESKNIRNIIENNYYYTLEAMMALAATDGDVGLSRALYFQYTMQKYKDVVKHSKGRLDYQQVWQMVLDPRLFNYLLLAYANFRPDKLPILLGYEQGAKFRRNILSSVDYAGRYNLDDEIKVQLPMLPIIDMNQTWQIMSESRALWQFNLEFGGLYDLRKLPEGFDETKLREMISKSETVAELKYNLLQLISQWKIHLVNRSILNLETLHTFLTIPVSNGDEKEFLLRLKEFTFQQHELEHRVEQLFESQTLIEESVQANPHKHSVSLDRKDAEDNVHYFASMKHKILAGVATYELMMKAASAFKDVELSTVAWKNRGEFRKTMTFQRMDAKDRIESDGRFAALMVQFLTGQRLFTDALAVVMSSQQHIDWRYPMVKGLHRGLLEIEDNNSVSILLGIVNKEPPSKYLE